MEDLLIAAENENPSFALIFDDHKKHLKSHIRYFWRPGMISHIWEHLKLWRHAVKNNIPKITLQDVVSHVMNPNRWQ